MRGRNAAGDADADGDGDGDADGDGDGDADGDGDGDGDGDRDSGIDLPPPPPEGSSDWSRDPPGGKQPSEVPQLVAVTFDDNFGLANEQASGGVDAIVAFYEGK